MFHPEDGLRCRLSVKPLLKLKLNDQHTNAWCKDPCNFYLKKYYLQKQNIDINKNINIYISKNNHWLSSVMEMGKDVTQTKITSSEAEGIQCVPEHLSYNRRSGNSWRGEGEGPQRHARKNWQAKTVGVFNPLNSPGSATAYYMQSTPLCGLDLSASLLSSIPYYYFGPILIVS